MLIGNESAIENAGSARSDGFDFSGSVSPIEGLTLGATLTYTDAVLTSAGALDHRRQGRAPAVRPACGAVR